MFSQYCFIIIIIFQGSFFNRILTFDLEYFHDAIEEHWLTLEFFERLANGRNIGKNGEFKFRISTNLSSYYKQIKFYRRKRENVKDSF